MPDYSPHMDDEDGYRRRPWPKQPNRLRYAQPTDFRGRFIADLDEDFIVHVVPAGPLELKAIIIPRHKCTEVNDPNTRETFYNYNPKDVVAAPKRLSLDFVLRAAKATIQQYIIAKNAGLWDTMPPDPTITAPIWSGPDANYGTPY